MPTYRLYRLDGAGRIDSAEWIEAPAEDLAIREARERIREGAFELWCGEQLVLRNPGAES